MITVRLVDKKLDLRFEKEENEVNKKINKYINKTEILKFIEDIKCDDNIPKNYGTLLDIMRYIRSMPCIDIKESEEK